MRKLVVMMIVGVLLLAVLIPGVAASDICITESVSCLQVDAASRERTTAADAARYTELAAGFAADQQLAASESGARLTGMAAYYSGRAAWGPRAQSAHYQALADYYASLPSTTATLSTSRGVGALYGR